ncbi:MAG: phenylalanine--tRNA ligase subunit alpha [Thermoproteota archaeon]|jgi:phenylalanyl-tRNA synthetase alpha chain|nr:phenylalanine--tRNA ligase subunit alpha [Thermoproteota archaeon]
MAQPSLHPIEKKILLLLSSRPTQTADIDAITKELNMSIDQVRRGIEWLKFKNLVRIVTETSTYLSTLLKEGTPESKLPERKIVELISTIGGDSVDIKELASKKELSPSEFSAGLVYALKNGWIRKMGITVTLDRSSQKPSPEEKLLQRLMKEKQIDTSNLEKDEIPAYQLLRKRPGFIVEINESNHKIYLSQAGHNISQTLTESDSKVEVMKITSELLRSGKWKHLKFSGLDVSAPVQNHSLGRTHPLTDLISEVKEIFVSMGFLEIEGPMIQSSFWNFDVLFTPQDHPAREMQDTFYIQGNIPTEDINNTIVKRVSDIHSKCWKYEWNIEEATRYVLRTHTTAVTLRYLADNRQDEARIFSVGRVFRNEKMTYKHLMEFHQVEGVVTGKDLTLRDLMGLQTLFYSRLGIKKVKFWPTYFPYTEPSLQSMVFIEETGKWIELFGMGIFRPEVTASVGLTGNVLAWGGGLERIAMIRYGLNDVRELYENRLSWLRSVPICRL